MRRHGEHGAIVGNVLLALIAAAVLGTGLLVVADRSVDQAAVTAAPETATGSGTTGPGTGTESQAAPDSGDDTATTSPEPSREDRGPDAPGPDPVGAGGKPTAPAQPPVDVAAVAGAATTGVGTGEGSATRPPGPAGGATPSDDGAQAATGPATPGRLPYGTAAAERPGAAATPGELARTGPAVPSSLAVLLVAAGLLAALVAWAGAPRED